METQYPDNLFKSVAQNILKKKNGQTESQSITKIAADVANARQAEREKFMQQHNFKPEDFRGDKVAEGNVNESMGQMESQVRDFYKQQRGSGMADPKGLKEAENKMLQDIQRQKEEAAQRFSIDRTLQTAKQDPKRFEEFKNLSDTSQNALGQSHGKEIGAGLGAIAGGALGMLGGKKLPKNTKGILQQAGGALAGGALGGITGGAIGSNRDEKRTGFNHEDVMKPYEIATRLNNQQNFR